MFCHPATISDTKGFRNGGIALALARVQVLCTIHFLGRCWANLVDFILGVIEG